MPQIVRTLCMVVACLLATAAPAVAVESADANRGVVNVYSARHYDTDDALYQRFTELTGIRVNVIEGRADELLVRLRQEGTLSPADVFIAVDAGRLFQAEQQGIFQPASSELLEELVPASLRHPEGLWFGLTKRARVLVVSRERVPDDVVALDYEDLALPAWRGRVLVRSSSNIYNQSMVSAMIATQGQEQAQAWCRGLAANFARRPQGGDRDQIRAVAAGEGDVAIVNHYYFARMLTGSEADREATAKLRVIFPNQDDRGTHVNISGAGVVRSAPNRENAVRFIEFLASAEAQHALASNNQEYPVAEGISITPELQGLGSFKADEVNARQLGSNNAEAVRTMDRAGWR